MSNRLVESLRHQLQFLRNSAEAYDSGFKGEAVRLAAVMRNLFKTRGRTVALLEQLGVWESLSLTSHCEIAERIESMGLMPVQLANFTFNTKDGPTPNHNLGAPSSLSCDRWWNGPVTVHEGEWLRRREIILTAAEKDGGVHVDAELTPTYEALQARLTWVRRDPTTGTTRRTPIPEHQIYIRKFAHELLDSAELLALAAPNSEEE